MKFTGTFDGTGSFCGYVNYGSFAPDGSVPFRETETFTGIVHGCGTGSVDYTVRGFVYVSKVNPANGDLPAEEDWQIVPGSGTGGLRGLKSGSGHDHAIIHSDLSIDADFTGSVKCVEQHRPGKSGPGASTTVSGTWLGDLSCAPTGASIGTDGSYGVTCVGGTGYAGGLSGHSYLTLVGAIAPDFSMKATYNEWFYGTYTSDGSYGSLHFVGNLTVDSTLGFHAHANIVGGTCGFSGSGGTIAYDGIALGGAYSAKWSRPNPLPAAPVGAHCVPPPPPIHP